MADKHRHIRATRLLKSMLNISDAKADEFVAALTGAAEERIGHGFIADDRDDILDMLDDRFPDRIAKPVKPIKNNKRTKQ